MKHFWPLAIAVLCLTAAQAGQVNNKPTLSKTQTMQPTTTSGVPRPAGKSGKSGPTEHFSLSYEEVKVQYHEQRVRSSGGRKLTLPSPAVQDLHGQ